MPKFFISYRRDDSLDIAGRIYDRLAVHFGRDDVFLDVDAIPVGVDFRTFLTEWVDRCDVVLVVIGRGWLGCRFEGGTKAGQRRLDDPADFVRIEVAAALARGIPVVPVLVGGAAMPGPEQLPPNLSGLAYRHAAEVRSGPDFHVHMDRLIRALERLPVTGPSPKPEARPEQQQPQESARDASPPRTGQSAQELTNSLDMKLVLILAGEFQMGSPDSDEEANYDERPRHHVQISAPFYLSQFAVTWGQYKRLIEVDYGSIEDDVNQPMHWARWFDAIAFCNRLSSQEEMDPYYKIVGQHVTILGGAGYRLPTEAEWEYACRAGSTTRYCFGDEATRLGEYAWYNENSKAARWRPHPVGQKKPNAWGLYDMHGNVWEWCWDGYDDRYYRQSPSVDPTGLLQSTARVLRGGSSSCSPRYLRSAHRHRAEPDEGDISVGFRVARVS